MIFVTVGTHEQSFNRLVIYMDKLKENNKISDEVIIQTGFSTYEPKYCEWKNLYPYSQMNELVKKARIVITHGGPSSFIMPLQIGKIPIVVPRQKKYNEHVNDHQVNFCREVSKRQKNIIEVEEIDELESTIRNYDKIVQGMINNQKSNNEKFCEKLQSVLDELMGL